MKPFDYLVVLVSILIGLAIADLTISAHRLLAARHRVRWHWAAPACALLAGLAVLRHFWVFWNGWRNVAEITLAGFLPLIVTLVLMFLGAAAALPDEVPAEGLDLKAFYLGNRPHFWGLTVSWFVLVVAQNIARAMIRGLPISPSLMMLNGLSVAIIVSLIVIRRLWWHAIGIALLLGGVAWTWMGITIA